MQAEPLLINKLADTGKGPSRYVAVDDRTLRKSVVGYGSPEAARKKWIETYGS